MFRNNNLSVCRRLSRREFRFHKSRNLLAVLSAALTMALFTVLSVTVQSLVGSIHEYSISEMHATEEMYRQLLVSQLPELLPYVLSFIPVFCCGFLIIYNIFRIGVDADIRFYGKLITLGMTPRQIRAIWYELALAVCGLGVPLGAALGIGGAVLFEYEILSFSKIPIGLILSLKGIAAAGALTTLTVLVSGFRPARITSGLSPTAAARYMELPGRRDQSQETYRKKRITPRRMAVYHLAHSKRRTAVVIASLSLAFILLSCVYVQYISADSEIYLHHVAFSDYTLSAVRAGENDTYVSSDLEPSFVRQAEALPGVSRGGALYKQEVWLNLEDRVYNRLTNYFESEGGWRLKEMQADQYWTRAYENMRKSHTCVGLVYGVDRGYTQLLAGPDRLIDGTLDAEQFAAGGYAIAEGADGEGGQPNYHVGERVEIGGRTFEIMALSKAPAYQRTDHDSAESAFSLGLFIPEESFRQLFPKRGICELYLNVEEAERAAVDRWLIDYRNTKDPFLDIRSKTALRETFDRQIRSGAAVGALLALTFGLIGIFNLANTLTAGILSRSQEFIACLKLGMSDKQLLYSMLWEGVCVTGLVLAVVYPLSLLAAGPGMYLYLTKISSLWAYQYRFSIRPLLACTPILLAVSAGIPLLCYRVVKRQSFRC
ncbi:ABC transporter permease [Lachnospiraceae bacterium ASD3451]|uniref:FtsX-like permease family protein n=1 Tax=Diplocloster agilis TaxID=2850323 RepID=UPI001D77B50E|nr:ABC transporter permease [Diplocloster agilis]MBU9743422.1 ABC transporter permease [Diplocloster agilis]